MKNKPELFYCAHGNRRFAQIAIDSGFSYGAQMPNTVYFPPEFTDQNWKTPNRTGYMAALAKYRPRLATVLDWERPDQLTEVLDWASEASQWTSEAVIIIPKVVGGTKRLPKTINGKSIRLGYSAATTFSGTPCTLSEFEGFPVHCLGGSPAAQMWVANRSNCLSADGNYIQTMARRRCQFYSPGLFGQRSNWPSLGEIGLGWVTDAPYIAFKLTCIAIQMAWSGATGPRIWSDQQDYLESIGLYPSGTQLPLIYQS
jgi:hypothetical protein